MMFAKKWAPWVRLLPIMITALLLCMVFWKVDFGLLIATFHRIHVVWLVAAVALYGALFLPAAWRWHLVLKRVGKAKNFGTTLRFSLIGHFFYTILFGVLGGDSAKAVVYARWHRLPAEEILATTPLDRFLGLIGSLVFAGLAFGVAATAGGFTQLRQLSLNLPLRWLVVALIILAILLVMARQAGKLSGWRRFWSTLVNNALSLARSPATLSKGFLCGLLVQIALSGVLALNLFAVSSGPIPWQKLMWTFPIIVAISALPITVGGLGTREGIATLLWSIYGVPRADAIAASLLTLTVGLVWAAAAGLLLLKNGKNERARHWRAIWPEDVSRDEQLRAESV